MKIRIVATVIMLAITGRGEAGFYTGSQILSHCESGDRNQQSFWASYLGGIADATELLAGAGLMAKLICMPSDTSRDRLQEIFVEYANGNPGELDEVGSATVIAAFLGAFPCI